MAAHAQTTTLNFFSLNNKGFPATPNAITATFTVTGSTVNVSINTNTALNPYYQFDGLYFNDGGTLASLVNTNPTDWDLKPNAPADQTKTADGYGKFDWALLTKGTGGNPWMTTGSVDLTFGLASPKTAQDFIDAITTDTSSKGFVAAIELRQVNGPYPIENPVTTGFAVIGDGGGPPESVPEPASLALLLPGLVPFGLSLRRRRSGSV